MFSNIIVPVDIELSEVTEKQCETAAALAKSNNAKVTLTMVLPGFGMPIVASYFPADAQKSLQEETRNALDELAKKHFSGEAKVSVRSGKRVKEILNEIQEDDFDLVVLGTRRKHSRGGERLLGSCSSGISDRASISVLIVR